MDLIVHINVHVQIVIDLRVFVIVMEPNVMKVNFFYFIFKINNKKKQQQRRIFNLLGIYGRQQLQSKCPYPSSSSTTINLVLLITLPIIGGTILISIIALILYWKVFRVKKIYV